MSEHSNLNRRHFVFGLGGGVLIGGCAERTYQQLIREPAVSAAGPSIDPNTIRRRGVGFRGYDPQRAFLGFTLFAPLTGPGTVYLMTFKAA